MKSVKHKFKSVTASFAPLISTKSMSIDLIYNGYVDPILNSQIFRIPRRLVRVIMAEVSNRHRR